MSKEKNIPMKTGSTGLQNPTARPLSEPTPGTVSAAAAGKRRNPFPPFNDLP